MITSRPWHGADGCAAGEDGASVQQDGARAALAFAAAVLGAGEPQLRAQHPQQRPAGVGVDLGGRSVEAELDRLRHAVPPSPSGALPHVRAPLPLQGHSGRLVGVGQGSGPAASRSSRAMTPILPSDSRYPSSTSSYPPYPFWRSLAWISSPVSRRSVTFSCMSSPFSMILMGRWRTTRRNDSKRNASQSTSEIPSQDHEGGDHRVAHGVIGTGDAVAHRDREDEDHHGVGHGEASEQPPPRHAHQHEQEEVDGRRPHDQLRRAVRQEPGSHASFPARGTWQPRSGVLVISRSARAIPPPSRWHASRVPWMEHRSHLEEGACRTMADDAYRPRPEHRFTFGLWTVGQRGADPFGDPTRPERSPAKLVRAARAGGRVGRQPARQRPRAHRRQCRAERDQIVRDFGRVLRRSGHRGGDGRVRPVPRPRLPRRRVHLARSPRPGLRAAEGDGRAGHRGRAGREDLRVLGRPRGHRDAGGQRSARRHRAVQGRAGLPVRVLHRPGLRLPLRARGQAERAPGAPLLPRHRRLPGLHPHAGASGDGRREPRGRARAHGGPRGRALGGAGAGTRASSSTST